MLRFHLFRFIKISLIVVGSMFILNAAIIYFAHPANVQGRMSPSSIADVGGVKVESYEDLRSGGVHAVGATVRTQGYVDMFSPELVVYVNNVDAENVRYSTLYKHELAHIHQKEMIAHETGGYPSYLNPVQSFRYYMNLIRLNNDLSDAMPDVTGPGATIFSDGLEAAADCYAQPNSNISESPVFYSASYVENGHCSSVERRNAIKLITTDKWFEPMSEELAAKMPEENIVDVVDDFDLTMLTLLNALPEEFVDFTEEQKAEAIAALEANEAKTLKKVNKDKGTK